MPWAGNTAPQEGNRTLTDSTNGKILVGIFRDRVKAEGALNELHEAGFTEEQTGFVIRGKRDPGDDESPIENDSDLEKSSTGGGILAGSTVGGVIGAVATGLIPGVGPVIAAGILAGVVGGAAAGGVAGGVIGTLKGIGIPDDEAKIYEEEFNAGHPLITVDAGDRREEAWKILQQHGAYDAHTRPAIGE